MCNKYNEALERVQSFSNQEILDFLARRIYEMASYCIMSALLLLDASADEVLFSGTLNRFIAISESIVAGHSTYICNFVPETINYFKQKITSNS